MYRLFSESSEDRLSFSSFSSLEEAKPIEIDGQGTILFLVDGKHFVSGGDEGKIRRWRVEDGNEVGTPINAESTVYNIAATLDGKWIVSGTRSGDVTVWNADSHEKVIEFQAHKGWVWAVDVSPDGTRIASGSGDETASVWSLSTGVLLLGPLKHDNDVVAVKFSPDGRLIATATCERKSVRIYDSWQDGRLLVDFPTKVNSECNNQSLAWASDSKQLFALSLDNNIHCLDVSTGKTLSKWLIHSSQDPACIALASNGMFIAASGGTSVSFWDVTTHKRIGSVIRHTDTVDSMAVSVNHDDIVIGGGRTITIQSLHGALPSPYFKESSNSKIARLEKTIRELGDELATCQRTAEVEKDLLSETITSLRADLHTQDESSNSKFEDLEKTIRELRHELATCQLTAKEEKDGLNQTISYIRADLRTQDESSKIQIAHLEKTVQDLRDELATSQRTASQKEDSLNKIFDPLEKMVQQLMVLQRRRTTCQCEYEVNMDWTAGS